MKKRQIRLYIVSLTLLFCSFVVKAQTDALLQQYLGQAKASGMSDSDIMGMATSSGFGSSVATKSSKKNPNPRLSAKVPMSNSAVKKDTLTPKTKIFGSDLFSSKNITFEPNLRMATPKNYQVGTGDEILVDIFGASEASLQLFVSPEGVINVPYVGVIPVSGLTMEQASKKITKKLSEVYTGIKSGTISVQVTLGNIRSIKVTVLGEVNTPGTYTLPSLATAFNALYASGGPNEQGSYRAIEVIRANEIVARIDLYEFLMKGGFKNNIRLEDQDVIRIPVYKTRVEFSGEVKRPALYEILPHETLDKVIQYAGGFSDIAYTAKIKVIQNTEKEHKIIDVLADEYTKYVPQRADKYLVEPILGRFSNRVSIRGAVYRPGEFELEKDMKLSQLIKKADGIKEDAFKNRAYIKRLRGDMTRELVAFDLTKVIKGEADEILRREDEVVIVPVTDLRVQPQLTIKGEVKNPGLYDYAEGITLEDLILMAGGLKVGGTTQRIEIASRVEPVGKDELNAKVSDIRTIDINGDLSLSSEKVLLKPYDVVTVRAQLGYERQRLVKIEGEVLYPGVYSLQRKNERISDLIKRAGGIKHTAYLPGASLQRMFFSKKQGNEVSEELLMNKHVDRLDSLAKIDSLLLSPSAIENEVHEAGHVFIDAEKIVKHPGANIDLILEEGDFINVPKVMQTIKIEGQVNAPVNTSYIPSKGLRGYVSQAGGLTPNAEISRAYVVYPNGRVKATKHWLFINWYPKILPGSEIVIPKKDLLDAFILKDVSTMLTTLASSATSLIAIIALIRN